MTQNYYYIGNSGYTFLAYRGPSLLQQAGWQDEGARNEAPQMAIDWIKIARQALAKMSQLWINYAAPR